MNAQRPTRTTAATASGMRKTRLAEAQVTRRQARRHGVDYAFLFMQANGAQLAGIAALIDAGTLRTVVDRVFPFAETNEALALVETGRAKGKVVIRQCRRGKRSWQNSQHQESIDIE